MHPGLVIIMSMIIIYMMIIIMILKMIIMISFDVMIMMSEAARGKGEGSPRPDDYHDLPIV